jgi:hypothetical protein
MGLDLPVSAELQAKAALLSSDVLSRCEAALPGAAEETVWAGGELSPAALGVLRAASSAYFTLHAYCSSDAAGVGLWGLGGGRSCRRCHGWNPSLECLGLLCCMARH